MTQQDIMTVEQIADVLRISKNTIQRKSWREKTGCPLRKKGKRLYAMVEEFNNWFKRS